MDNLKYITTIISSNDLTVEELLIHGDFWTIGKGAHLNEYYYIGIPLISLHSKYYA